MGALLAFRPRQAAPPPPHNDNIPAWQGHVYAPHAPAGGLVERVFALRFWGGAIRAAAARLVARRILP